MELTACAIASDSGTDAFWRSEKSQSDESFPIVMSKPPLLNLQYSNPFFSSVIVSSRTSTGFPFARLIFEISLSGSVALNMDSYFSAREKQSSKRDSSLLS